MVTRAERRLKILFSVWFVLFGSGVIVTTALPWHPLGTELYQAEPLLLFVWFGQIVLFLCTLYLLSGIRDNELCAPVVAWYKLLSGTAMLAFVWWSRGPATDSALPVVAGALLDYVMGGLTFGLWLVARRSRFVRMPFSVDIIPPIDEEPAGRSARTLRIVLGVSAGLFGQSCIAFFFGFLFTTAPQSAVFKIAAANACGVYGAVGFLGMLAAEAPRRRAYTLDIVIIASWVAGAGFLTWLFVFPLEARMQALYLVMGVIHLGLPVLIMVFSALAARAERPTTFFGPWLHRVFETFAEVMLRGSVEVVTPREIADGADAYLTGIQSKRKVGVKLALGLIELGAILFRMRVPMSRMGRLERHAYLTATYRRGHGLFRDLIKVRQLVMLMYYADTRAQEAIGFVPLEQRERYKKAQTEGKLPPEAPVTYPPSADDAELQAQVCVIGSGAGGAVVAARLAEHGVRVVVIEEGPYLKRDQITQNELTMQLRAYREGGLQTSLDFDMYVLQGSCVGGSTFVNNGISFALPDDVLGAWHALGATLPADGLQDAFARLRREIGLIDLKILPELVEKGAHKFVVGCERLGIPADWFDVNLDGCFGCGYCTSGCQFEKKMSMDRSFVPRALEAGATLVSECRAEQVVVQGPRATAVLCRRADGSPLTVKADNVVVAGGAIHSSLLLHRSGLGRNVGTRLSFNVGSWVAAEFREEIDAFDGVQMCAYHERSRYFIETFAAPPSAFAVTMPGWFEDHFDHMQRYRHFAVAGALTGTQAVGRVKHWRLPVIKDLVSPIDFTLPVADLRKLREGIKLACKIWLAAGAIRVIPATFHSVQFTHTDQVERLDEMIVEADDISFGSSHPQGGNPMSNDPEIGVVNTDFRVHGFDNVFVCDASVFPTSIQVNPQLTIMALADYAVGRILDVGHKI